MPYSRKTPTQTKSKKKVYKKKMYPQKSIRNVVNSMSETKKHTLQVTEVQCNSLVSPTGTNVHEVDYIPNGAGYAQRIGHKIKGVGMNIRGHVIASSGRQQYVKMAVIRLKDNSSEFITSGLENDGGNQSPVGGMETIWRRINTDAYEVLATRTFRLGTSSGGGNFNDNATKMFKIWVPFRRTVGYDGAGANPPKYNRVQIIWWSADALNDTVGTDVAEYSFCCDYYFKDM